MDGLYNTDACFSPARAMSPQARPPAPPDAGGQYLQELLQEHQKLGPFMQVLPICSRLLNQEIMRVSSMVSHHGVGDFERLPIVSPNQMHPSPHLPNFSGNGFGPWSGMHHAEESAREHNDLVDSSSTKTTLYLSLRRCCALYCQRVGCPQGNVGWQGAGQTHTSYIVKKILRLEIPTDTFPNFNFIGRLLGPRGNSLKRIEASTGCRVFIRGKGSIKDSGKEEQLKGRPGYEHLDEPLHILIEAELPANVIDLRLAQAQQILEELLKPVDESQDHYKRQQLRELAMLNSPLREESPHSVCASPFSNGSMKRVKQ